MDKVHLIGLTGTAGAGKDTVADLLCKMFVMRNLSSGDAVRAMTRYVYHLPADFNPIRDQLYEVANYFRNEIDPAIFVKMCVLESKASKIDKAIISGLRSMGEAQAVRNAGGIIVGVDADPHIRYNRMFSRARDAEAQKSLEEFLEQDEHENRGVSDQGVGRGIRSIIDSADLVINNNGTVEELQAELNAKIAPLFR
ncbi:MAG TPA: AAA family ATPase [Patescibacteria group bacterium]|nr:AAA family ATPase [Patescibacteria group bacterium]